MKHDDMMKVNHDGMTTDMAKGFSQFADELLRGRSNKTILNSSVGLAALEMGVPSAEGHLPADAAAIASNNLDYLNPGSWGLDNHPLFDLSAENFTLFGLDFVDFWNQLQGAESIHHSPIYDAHTVGEKIGLPDLPYGELAHFAHMGMALYDTGRTFQDLWQELAEHAQAEDDTPLGQAMAYAKRTGKIATHPEMWHTLAARGTMLTVMGLLHPLGAMVSIGVAYLCMHMVHSFFGLLEKNKDTIQQIENVPVLRHVYNASGIKEWAERDTKEMIEPFIDAYNEPELQISDRENDGRVASHLSVAAARP